MTGVVRDSGTITRNGEDTNVLVSVLTEGAAFYYDTKDQLLFDTVFYPTELAQKVALSGDVRGMYKSIDFVDLNGDEGSDVTMKFDDSISRVYSYIGSISQYYKRPDHFFFRLARTIITTAATAIAAAA